MYGCTYNKRSILEKYDSTPTTNSNNLVTSGTVKAYVDGEIASTNAAVDAMIDRVGNPFVFKGTVASLANLPSSGNTVNDTYFVEAEGFMYTWNGTSFDKSSTDVNNQLAQDIATEYDEQKVYKAGEFVLHNNQVYVRNADATTAEGTFVTANWTATSLGDELYDEVTNLNSALFDTTSDIRSAMINNIEGYNYTGFNLMGDAVSTRYPCYIPRNTPWTISTSDGSAVSQAITIYNYDKSGEQLNSWTLGAGSSSRTVPARDYEIYYLLRTTAYSVPLMVNIGDSPIPYKPYIWPTGNSIQSNIQEIEAMKEQDYWRFHQGTTYTDWIQGNRYYNNIHDVLNSSTRVTTKIPLFVSEGSMIVITGLTVDQRCILFGSKSDGTIYDSGWKSGGISYLATTSGMFSVIVGNSDESSIVPQQVQAVITIVDNTSTIANINEVQEYMDVSYSHLNLVNYGYDTSIVYPKLPSAIDSDTISLGVTRRGTKFILDGTSWSQSYTYVMLNGPISRKASNTGVASYNYGINLISGHRYNMTCTLISGTVSSSTYASLYATHQGENTVQGVRYYIQDGVATQFIADASPYNFVLMIPSNITFTNATFRILLQDVTASDKSNYTFNAVNNIVDYGGTIPFTLLATPDAQDVTTLGVERNNSIITLSGTSTPSSPTRVRINSSVMTRTGSDIVIQNWSTDYTVQLTIGKRYRVSYKLLEGSLDTKNVSISVYRAGESSTVGVMKINEFSYEREFVADVQNYFIVLYISSEVTFNDIKLLVTLQDVSHENRIDNKYLEEISDTIDKVKSIVTSPCLVFPWVTDIHRNVASIQNFSDMISNMKCISKDIKFDFILNTGDTIEGNKAQSISLELYNACKQDFLDIGIPYYYANGNHDINPYINHAQDKFSIAQTYVNFYQQSNNTHYNYSESGTDYYVDIDNLKVRIVSVNSSNGTVYAYGTTTATWLTDHALDTDYTVIFVAHISPIPDQVWNNTSPTRYSYIASALQSFVDAGGTLISITGHSHVDLAYVSPWLSIMDGAQKCENFDPAEHEGYNLINGYIDVMSAPTRTEGTYTEDLWSICVYKPETKDFSVIRFGAGVDRYFHVNPISSNQSVTSILSNVTWSSSNTSIATVSNGAITVSGTGRCAILAKDTLGNYECWIVEH